MERGRVAGLVAAGVVALVAAVGVPLPADAVDAHPIVTDLDGGPAHTCAIKLGAAWCWGNNADGELGDGTGRAHAAPAAVDTTGVLAGVTLTRIGTGDFHTCALSAQGRAYCWGSNAKGQLGDGSTTKRLSPVAVDTSGVLAGVTLTQITAGGSHTCALSTQGRAYCWGWNTGGALGDGTTNDANVPMAVDTSGVLAGVALTQIGGGGVHTCALSAQGRAYCWGWNGYGRVGDGTDTNRLTPVAVDTGGALAGVTLTQLSVGYDQTCVLSTQGRAYCWGSNMAGGLGIGTTADANVPMAVNTSGVLAGVTLTQLTGGGNHMCALSSQDRPYCWGSNSNGQLGDGTTTDRLVPVTVDTGGVLAGATLVHIDAGSFDTCVVSSRSRVYCWGYNILGGLGDGTSTDRHTPTLTLLTVPPTPPTAVSGVPGNDGVTVSWHPSNAGTGRLTGYTVTAQPGGATCTTDAATNHCTVIGLADGTPSTFTVVAVAADDRSDPSDPSAAVTPHPRPGAPTAVTPRRDAGAILPVTGEGITGIITIGASLVLAGIMVRIRYRRRTG